MRLHRPYIPVAIRVMVAERQARQRGLELVDRRGLAGRIWSDSKYLKILLSMLFDGQKAELHHRPALVNRRRYIRNGKSFYDPPANSDEHLFYLLDDDHDIETRVRGVGAQLSDLGTARKRKRRERKAKKPKKSWPSRQLRSANRWPKKSTSRAVIRSGVMRQDPTRPT